MAEKKIQYIPIASTVLAAALIALAIGFSAPTGEQSKLAYEGDLWCVSNFIEKEPVTFTKDGRPEKDERLKGKEDWIIKEQVKADSKEQAEASAQKYGTGRFEPSDKTRLRQALDANEKEFFITHFNSGATSAGPCLGAGSTQEMAGQWLNDAIREDCFGLKTEKITSSFPDDNSTSVNPANLSSTSSGSCKDLRNAQSVSEKSIYDFLKKNKSPMANSASAIVQAGKKYNVSPALLVAISYQESSLGKAGRGAKNKNPGNIKAARSTLQSQGINPIGYDNQRHTIFQSWDDGIAGLAYILNRTYFSKGRTTLLQIAEIYLEGDKNDWIKNVDKILGDLCKSNI